MLHETKPYGTVPFVSTGNVASPPTVAERRMTSDDRRAHYVEIALQLFMQHGFNGVSTDQLVAASGGSKATLYRYFPSKEALFAAIIDDVAAPALAAEGDDSWDAVDLAVGLRRIGRATADAALDPRTILLMRLAVGEHARFPQLAATLFEHGPRAPTPGSVGSWPSSATQARSPSAICRSPPNSSSAASSVTSNSARRSDSRRPPTTTSTPASTQPSRPSPPRTASPNPSPCRLPASESR